MNTTEVKPAREIVVSPSHLRVFADEPSNGGSSHTYSIGYETEQLGAKLFEIHFQEGPILETGVNGISTDALLRILVDHLQGFQRGSFSCRENALAITKLEEALHWIQHRTFERAARGVEGTSQI